MKKIIWNPSLMGKKGGKKSVEKRFKNLTKNQISEIMKQVRLKEGKKI